MKLKVRQLYNSKKIRDLKFIFFIRPFFILLKQPNQRQGPLILEVSRLRTMTQHRQQHSSRRVIGQPQRPLRDNTQSQQTSMPPVGFESTNPASERP